jgi:hypothetical protein
MKPKEGRRKQWIVQRFFSSVLTEDMVFLKRDQTWEETNTVEVRVALRRFSIARPK